MIPERISEQKVEEILRLASEEELTQGEIAEQVGVSRATAGKYIRQVKKKLKAKNPGRIVVRDLNELCEAITPLILEKLGNQNPDKKNEDKEEKEMGEEDLAAKMHMLRQREREQEKRDNAVVDLTQKVEEIYEQQKKIMDGLSQPKESEAIEGLKDEVEKVRKQQELFCDPKSGQCFVTKAELEKFIKEQTEKIPQIYGGHQDLNSLFRSLAKEGNEEFDKAIQARIPASLKVKWIQDWCKDGECKPLLKEQGITIHDDEEPRRGAYPGNAR